MKKIKKKYILLILLLIIIGVGAFIIFGSPAKTLTATQKEDALTKMLGRKPVLNQKEEAKGNVEYKGKYVSFMYPARAKIYVLRVNGEVKKDNWNLDSLNFDLDVPRATVLVTVSNAPTGVMSLNDYPSIRLRQLQPGMYKAKDIKVAGVSGFEFDKKDNLTFEKSAFFYIDNRIYFFSAQGSDVQAIEDLFKKIMLSVKFLSGSSS